MEKLKKYKVTLRGTETVVFYGSDYEECDTYRTKNGGRDKFHIESMYDKKEIENLPENKSIVERSELLGKDIVTGCDVRDNFLIIDKYGMEYHISYEELISALKQIRKFSIEKKRVRRWLHLKKQKPMLSKKDIHKVAKDIGFTLTSKQVNVVMGMYNGEQENDPTATWDLVVENCIYMVLNNKS